MDPTTDPHPTRRRRPLRATVALLVVALLGGLLHGLVPPAAAAAATPGPSGPWSIERVSVGPDGTEGDGDSRSPVLSTDARTLVYETDATDLVPSSSHSPAVVARDLTTGTVEDVSVDGTGGPLSSPREPAVDADGSKVVMSVTSGGERALVLRDRTAGTTSNVGPGIALAAPAISDAGDRTAFVQNDATDGDADHRTQVWLRDDRPLGPGDQRETQISQLTGLDDQASQPVISADGNTVAYLARIDGVFGTRVQDVTARPFGEPEWYPGMSSPALSADGRYLATIGYVDGTLSVRRHDRLTGTDVTATTLPGLSAELDITADGSTVAYATTYRDDAGENRTELRVTAVATGRTEAVATVDASPRLDLSADGKVLAFSSDAATIVDGDTNRASDVFVARRTDSTAPTWPLGAALVAEDVSARMADLRWPAAEDDSAVAGYLLSRDGQVIADLPATATSYRATGLTPETGYDFSIVPVDTDGNTGPALRRSVFTQPDATDPGTAALAATAGPGGSILLQWDPAGDPVDAYRVLRAEGDGELVPVADVAGTTTEYHDDGLSAETAYRYAVVAVRGGVETPHSVEATATTPSVSITATTWAGRNRLGSDVTATILGAPGWSGTAEVEYRSWYGADGQELSEPRDVTVVLPAAEDPGTPGTYRATFPLADGTSQVTRITGVLSDGGDHSVRSAASRGALVVDGALSVTLDAPANAFAGAHLIVPNVGQAAVDGGGTSDFPDVPAGTRTIQVVSAHGRVLAESTVAVLAGRRAQVTLVPALPAQVVARVLDPAGRPVTGAVVAVARHGGTVLGTGRTDSQGLFDPGLEEVAGETVDLSVTAPAHLPLEDGGTSTDLAPGQNLVVATLPAIPTGTVSGTVTLDTGGPAAGARVVLDQTRDGRSWTFSADTDADGHYRVVGIVGSATLTVAYRQESPTTVGPFDVAATTTEDVVLARAADYVVHLDLFTRTVDQDAWDGPLDIDWATSAHLGVEVSVGDGVPVLANSGDIDVSGRPGDVAKICVHGDQAGMTSSCQEITLGDDHRPTVELRMSAVARVTGRMVTAGGSLPTGADAQTVVVSRIADGGKREFIFSYPVHDGRFSVNVATAGPYELAFFAGRQVRVVDMDIADGDVIDLGDVAISSSPWATRSSLTTTRRAVLPGGRTDVRALVHPGTTGPQRDVVAKISLPAGTELVAGSILLDGRPVQATVENGVLVVPLPDRTFTSAANGDEGWVVHYQLQVTSARPGDGLRTDLAVVHSGDSQGTFVASLDLKVAAVTVEVPARSASRTVVMTGWAPADSEVQLLDGRIPVGRATASPGGRWSLQAELPDLGDGTTHVLSGSVDLDGEPLVSKAVPVDVDTRLPELQRVTVSRDGLSTSFDPRDGVARFPFVFRGSGLAVSAEFGGRGTVEDVRTRVGTTTGAATQTGERSWAANLVTPATTLGTIGVDYTSSPEVIGLEDQSKPTLDQVRSRVPASIADFGEPTVTAEPPTADTTSATVTTPLPSQGDGASIRSTLSITRGLDYTPTAGDLVAVKTTGVQMWGATFDSQRRGDTITTTVHGYLPADLLVSQGIAGATRLTAGLAPGAAVDATLTTVFTQVQWVDGINSAEGTGDKYDRLNNLLDNVTNNCDPFHASMYRDALMTLNDRALATDATHASIALAGVLLAPETFGIGTLAVWGVTYFLDKEADYLFDGAVTNLAQQINADCRRDDGEDPSRPPDQPDDPGVADPQWIHDPSGYAFEAVPSNRLPGVTASLLHASERTGTFAPWDAEWYGQRNPETTDDRGAYGWDVPVGFWQVLFTKDGYEPARSDVLEVLPPHYDVNQGLVSRAAPQVREATATSGDAPHVDVTFSKYMQLSVLDDDRIAVTAPGGDPVVGTWAAADAEDGPSGRFARTFRFTPDGPLADGDTLRVDVEEQATSYAGVPMAAPFGTTVQAVPPAPAAPVAVDDRATVDEDHSVGVDVLANDTGGAAPLEVVGLTQPAHGTAAPAADGTVTYTPAKDWNGTDTFTYRASDGTDSSDPATVEVEVAPVADAPVAGPAQASGDEDTTIVVDPAGAATDADGDALTVAAVTVPGHGTATVRLDGKVDYRPAPDWNGTDTFGFTVTDGALTSAPATATVTVRPVNDAPTATADSASTVEGDAVTVDVLGNDADADGDVLVAEIVDGPAHGTATATADRTVRYTPAAGWSGTDTFRYRAVDPSGATSGTVTVTIAVTPAPTAPPCTITGTPGPDVLRGTPGDDVICGLGGNDVILGMGGDDVLDGGAGVDVIDGGAGRDVIDGGGGTDIIAGGSGDDVLDGGADFDLIDGGTGRDGWRRGDRGWAVRIEYRS